MKKYALGTEENREFQKEAGEELLRFGHRIPSPGGGVYWLGDDGTPMKDKPRETYENARMLHVYCMGMFLGHEGSRELAMASLNGLIDGELRDKEHGGWFNGVNADGTPEPDKLCYAHAFVMLGASSAILAGLPGAEKLLEDAEKIYDEKFWNEKEGMSADVWDTNFETLDDYRGLNANMHSVEAFLAVADVTGDEKYRRRAGRIIDRVIGWAGHNNWRIPEHYTKNWEPCLEMNREKPDDQFKPYGATPGHGIEWSRLITQWALSTFRDDRKAAQKYLDASEHLFGRAIADGWYCDGEPGIVYTTDWDGQPVVHDRMHWTLAEAIGAASVHAAVSGKEIYAACYHQFEEYMDEKVRDHVNGSWFHQMDEKNQPKDTVWPGKPDIYHAFQSTLIPFYQPDYSIAYAVCRKLYR